MTTWRTLGGVLAAALAFGPLVWGIHSLRLSLRPNWSRARGGLADAVLVIVATTLIGELLGSVGSFRLVPVTLALAVVGLLVGGAARRHRTSGVPPTEQPPQGAESSGTIATIVAAAITLLAVGEWAVRVSSSMRVGIEGIDSVWYHLPTAARFVQDGSVTGLHYHNGEAITAFFPWNSELFHAVGMLLFGSDILSPLLNVGWLALALIAAWTVGAAFDMGPHALAGAAVVLASPGMVETQAGEALSDMPGIAIVLAAMAIVATRERGERHDTVAFACAAVAVGWAAGTKVSFLPVAGVLALLVVVLAPRQARLRALGATLVLLGLGGGFWYARNLAQVGNPVPWVQLEVAGVGLPSPEIRSSVGQLWAYAGDGVAWDRYFEPGLNFFLGAWWPAFLAVGLMGLMFMIMLVPSAVLRCFAVGGAVTVAAFLFGPQNLDLASGEPFFFPSNLRYLALALVLGFIGVALLPVAFPRLRWLPLALFAALAFAQGREGTLVGVAAAGAERLATIDSVVAAGAVGVLGTCALAWHVRRRWQRWLPAAGAVLAVVALAGTVQMSRVHHRGWYADAPPMPEIYRWASSVEGQRIAVVHTLSQYPLVGFDLTNHVQYLGEVGRDGSYSRIRSCAEWKRALNQGRYDWLVVGPGAIPIETFGRPPETGWTASDPAARIAIRDGDVTLVELRSRLDPDRCP